MTASQRLCLLAIIAENAALPWASSGTAVDSSTRRAQNGAAATTVIAGEMGPNRFLNPGQALDSVAKRNVTDTVQYEHAAGNEKAWAAANAGLESVLYNFNLLKIALACVFVPIEYFNGFGDTDTSSKKFSSGRTTFSVDIWTILDDAKAVDSAWSGKSTKEYEDQNAAQLARVNKMAAADARIADLLNKQGSAVADGREQLAAVRLAATGGIVVAGLLLNGYLRWYRLSFTSWPAFQHAVALASAFVQFVQLLLIGLTANAIEVITTLGIQGTKTKHRIDNVTQDGYQWITDDWRNNKPADPPVVRAPIAQQASTVPHVAGILDRPADAAKTPEAAVTAAQQPAPVASTAGTTKPVLRDRLSAAPRRAAAVPDPLAVRQPTRNLASSTPTKPETEPAETNTPGIPTDVAGTPAGQPQDNPALAPS